MGKIEANEVDNKNKFVDLGLPSGTLWATCNVGAYSAGDYGDYFAWGEIQPKLNRTIGLLFTGPNGNSIFLPAGGSRMDGGRYGVGEHMSYLTNSLCSESGYPSFARVWVLGISEEPKPTSAFNHRTFGYLVRPVFSPED